MRLRRLALGVAVLLALGIIAIGSRFLLAPGQAAIGFGIPATTGGGEAYLAAKGLRDIASGLIGLLILAVGTHRVLAWYLLGATIIPIGDVLIVLSHGGSPAVALGVHGATAAVMASTAVVLLRGSDPTRSRLESREMTSGPTS
ncbi:hypothetical protein FHR81_004196 [Actinoalloteichus hoggarensis]|uniref:Uncharacterized protein n=1 Tax=Actinoalloteichus hoggarensis TaxID=1470176 RepID=A0A221WAX8_9PSEU|nr:DUF4267 domain-containing protein [Actinoalloteichus hoggarensis]ASO22447.1 hypothetical protein AHOG_24205 [Actinoalloteichus hoggarensis]MBB5923129.1 hypothetical protein [Actinoalloteichus hoggarensis]